MKKIFHILSFCLITVFSSAQTMPLLWESRYAGAGDNSDKFNKIIAVPGGDYVAVGFTTRNGTYKDFLTVKISGVTMDTLWTRTKGVNDGDDEAISCAADAAGNIYVTGYRDGGKTKDDIFTIKYSPLGVDLWDTAFNSPVDSALLDERPVDCGIDPSGNFIVAGWTEWGSWATNQNDFLVLKYDENGSLLWRTRYDRSGFRDEATAMAIDDSGDVFVTGRSAVGTDDDWVTMKLDGSTGAQLWIPVKIYSGGVDDDRPADIALDNQGFPVVVGRSRGVTYDRYQMLKYSSAGALLQNKFLGGSGHCRPYALAIDQATNDVYITGEKDVDLTALVDFDAYTVKYNASGIFQWDKYWSGAALDEDVGKDIVVDPFGNILVCGNTDQDPDKLHSNFDWLVLKYDASGNSVFGKTFNGTRNDDDEASSLVSDASGNALVAGYINNIVVQKDAARLIYDAAGNPTNSLYYNGEGDFNESSHAMVQDINGNTYIAGYTYTETDNRNIFAGKIDPSGNLVATFTYNGTNDDDDELTDIAYDGNGDIYACGYTKTDGEKSNFILIRFNTLLDTQWVRTYNFIGQSDKAVSLDVDASGIYVTGESDAAANDTTANDDIFTIKYNAGGNVLWSQRYDDSLGWRDQPVKLILGQNNTVYIAGRNSNAHDDDIVVLAYDRTSGNSKAGFPAIWNNIFSDDDRATDLIEDANGNIYVSGYSQSNSFVEDYTLLKYSPSGVSPVWTASYDGQASQEDQATALALDGSGNVIVTGKTDVDNNTLVTNYNYGTFIYDSQGNWVCTNSLPFTYNGAGDGDDVPVAVNVNGNEILVTGQSVIDTNGNKNIMVRVIGEGACSDMSLHAEYDGPAGGGDAPNATILASSALFITGSSDGTDMQKDIITLKYDVSTGLKNPDVQNMNAMVYPNPVYNVSTISVSNLSSNSGNLAIKIYNVLGEVVYAAEHLSSDIKVNKANFDDGVYSFQMFDSGKMVAGGRFVVD